MLPPLLLELFLLLRLVALQAREFPALRLGLDGQPLQVRRVRAQRGDEFGAGPIDVAQVVHLPRDLVGVLAVEHEAQRLRLARQVLLIEQLREQRVLRLGAFQRARLVLLQPRKAPSHRALLAGQLEQAAVGVADGALGFAQGVGGLGLGVFGFGQLPLQLVDPAAQLLELIRRAGVGGRGQSQEGEQQDAGRYRARHRALRSRLSLGRHRPHRGGDPLLIAEVVVAHRLQRSVQLVHQRRAGGDVQLDDVLVRHVVQVLDQGTDRVAVRRDDDSSAGLHGRRDAASPVRQKARDGVLQALGGGSSAGSSSW